ncbi:aminotransferase class III-fold pyridoxal phosphate-dependent enzyme [Nocardiopsis salina]|uniref:aminotransferase class III-fold pyridoxal phosphate-dependent enzyme n=1 Tax=Nocardiopsis salina TaxID=245836 RepID=UPI000346DA4C|nr:aminotransferase class III-fold pyridoxal phosphate-dependent enzyme [Nocardiopsis salina]
MICSFGRLGHWFGEGLTGVVPDLITFAKGSTSGYAPLGGMIARSPLVEALYDSEQGGVFTHGATWGGHPVSTAVAHANISAMRDEDVLENVRERGPGLKADLEGLMDTHNCVKDVRGTGYFYALELMADRADARELTRDQHLKVLRETLPAAFERTGVSLRGDDRGGTMLMVSPPLVAQDGELRHLVQGIDSMLECVEKELR